MNNQLNTEGTYPAKVNKAELGESSKGTPFVRLDFETPSGEISAWKYCSDRALEYTLKDLKEALSFDGNFANLEQMHGKECSIVTEFEDDDKGQERLRVKFINAKGSGGGSALDENRKASLAAMLSQKAGYGSGGAAAQEEQVEDDPF